MSDNKNLVISVVVLNYMNYLETVNCVNSILRQENVDYHIVIVDNGSSNESFLYLRDIFRGEERIHVIRARKNYGFAKGNNIGIHYARNRLNSDCVLLLNSDTILIGNDYLYNMVSEIQEDIGVVGSRIINRDETEQLSYSDYVKFPATLINYLYMQFSYWGWEGLRLLCERKLKNYEKQEILHGSNLLLTPQYFAKYSGLYDKTFLYGEEPILYLYCAQAGLKQKKTNKAALNHIGKQSTKFLYDNKRSARERYQLNSYKYVILNSLKVYLRGRRCTW